MKFIYQAKDQKGKIETGTIEASSKEAAAALLRKYNITVVSLKEAKPSFFAFGKKKFAKKISKKDLAIFSRQLAVMLDARVPVVQSLLTLAAQSSNTSFREVLSRLVELVEEGNTLSEAFSAFPKIFDVFYINLIRSGEASGKISESLYYLGDHLEREYDITGRIKGALVYPAVVLAVFVVVIIIVMTFVMPKLISLMAEMGGEVPLMTRILIGFYQFFLSYGWIILLAFMGLIIFLVYYFRTEEGRKVYDRIIFKVPFINSFLEKIFLIRFAENLSTLIMAGLPITRALKITQDTIGNEVYKEIVFTAEKNVSEGEKISAALVRYPERVPAFVVQMVKVGEETGKLSFTLNEIVNFYQKEIKRMVDNFMTLIEPILIIFLGIMILILAVSVISPLYGILGSI